MSKETYPCYVKIGEAGKEEIEIPTEDDGTMLLSSIQSQFPSAIGLRYKAESGAWRGLHVSCGVLQPPLEGWGKVEYSTTKGGKRKMDQESVAVIKNKKVLSDSDLIVLGLPFAATDEDVKTYFEQYGELESYEVKIDATTQKSKGFGFIKFKTPEAVEAVLAVPHTIDGRRCEVRFPKRQEQETPTKLFIGRLPKGSTVEDLTKHFGEFGALTDAYIPTEFRGFGFVTFGSVVAAQNCLASTHVLKGSYLNVCHPQNAKPKNKEAMRQPQAIQNKSNGYYSNVYSKTGKVA